MLTSADQASHPSTMGVPTTTINRLSASPHSAFPPAGRIEAPTIPSTPIELALEKAVWKPSLRTAPVTPQYHPPSPSPSRTLLCDGSALRTARGASSLESDLAAGRRSAVPVGSNASSWSGAGGVGTSHNALLPFGVHEDHSVASAVAGLFVPRAPQEASDDGTTEEWEWGRHSALGAQVAEEARAASDGHPQGAFVAVMPPAGEGASLLRGHDNLFLPTSVTELERPFATHGDDRPRSHRGRGLAAGPVDTSYTYTDGVCVAPADSIPRRTPKPWAATATLSVFHG